MALDASAPAAHWRPQFPPGPLFKEIHELRTLSQLVKRVSGRISKRAEPLEKRAPEPRPPPPLPHCFLLSHLEEDGPVRIDGVKLGVSEVLGLELDESKLGAFAGALNALDFPAQLLVRQHPPRLERLRSSLSESRPEGLPQRTRKRGCGVAEPAADRSRGPGRHPRPALLCRLRVRAGGRPARAAGAGRSFGPPARGPGPADVPRVRLPGRVSRRVRRERPLICGGQPPRHAHRRHPRALPPPRQMAAVALAGIPAGPHGRRRADGPLDTSRRHTGGAGGPHPGVAEGAFRVGAEPVAQAGAHDVLGGGDRPGGRDEAARRGAAGKGEALSLLPVRHAACEGRGIPQGGDPAGQGPLRRDAGEARLPRLPPEGGTSLRSAARAQRRRHVAHARHLQPGEALSVLAARPRHQERHALRHRPQGLLARGVRPLRRNAPQRQHRRAGPLRQREVVLHEARNPQGTHPRRRRIRDRP